MAGTQHNQDRHDSYHSSTGPLDPTEPWTWKAWWNGPDANGNSTNHTYTSPVEARTVCGGGNIYIPAGTSGLYALPLTSTGHAPAAAWNLAGNYRATPVYDVELGTVYVGDNSGVLSKINASTGAVVATYTAGGGALRKAPLLVGSYLYLVGFDGKLHKVHKGTMAAAWVYTPTLVTVTNPISNMGHGSTPAVYSPSRDCLVYATDDLYVHAVANTTGLNKWRVKPTTQTAGGVKDPSTFFGGVTFERGWPVLAERHGYVLMRLQIAGVPYCQSFPGPNANNIAHTTQSAIQTFLAANPLYQNLFVMSLDDGSAAPFTPAVLYTYNEGQQSPSQGDIALMPTQPVVKVYPNGDEVVYINARQGREISRLGNITSLIGNGTTVTATVPSTSGIGSVSASPNYQPVYIQGASNNLNGILQVTITSATTFTFPNTFNGTATTPGTYGLSQLDWRWDGFHGEMVLDSTTVAGLSAGQLRFMKIERYYYSGGVGYFHVNDERGVSNGLYGNTVLHPWFGAMEGSRLTDRSTAHGFTPADPMPMTEGNMRIVYDQEDLATGSPGYVPTTHYTPDNLSLGRNVGAQTPITGDGRSWDPGGFWMYWNRNMVSYQPVGDGGVEAWLTPNQTYGSRDCYVNDGYLIMEGPAGEIGIFTHSATVPTSSVSGFTVLT